MTEPVYLSSDAVDAAARTAHAQVTYANIEPGDPAYPFPEGGFWGRFMHSLEARWEHVRRTAFEGYYEDAHLFGGENCTGCGAEKTVMFAGQQWCKPCAPWRTETEDVEETPSSENRTLGEFA